MESLSKRPKVLNTLTHEGRMVYVYEKQHFGHRSNVEKRGVKKRRKVEDRTVLFLGTGRSGSSFLEHLMKAWDLDVRHETTGADGSSSHFFHSDWYWYPWFPWKPATAHLGERLSDYNFINKVHVVRNPLTCIPSIAKIFPTMDWEFAMETGLLPDDCASMKKLHRIMLYWYELNRRAEEQCDVRIQLENIGRDLPDVMKDILGYEVEWPEKHLPRNKGTGYRRSQPTTMAGLSGADPKLVASIKKMAKRYGYDV